MCPSPFRVRGLSHPAQPPRRVLSGVLGCGSPHPGNSRRRRARLPEHDRPRRPTSSASRAARASSPGRSAPATSRRWPDSSRASARSHGAAASWRRSRSSARATSPSSPRSTTTATSPSSRSTATARSSASRATPRGTIATTGRRSPSPWSTNGTAAAWGRRSRAASSTTPSRSGLAALTASTLTENSAAAALLRRLGFTRSGVSAGIAEYELALATALPAAA